MNFPNSTDSSKKNISPHQLMILLSRKAVLFPLAILLTGVIFINTGCSSSSETIIKDKKVSVNVPPVVAEIKESQQNNFDPYLVTVVDSLATDSTYYEFHQITEKNIEVKAKVFLKDKDTQKPKLELEVKQPDVEFSYTDTTTHTTIKEANSPVDYLIYLIILAVIVAAVILIIKFKR